MAELPKKICLEIYDPEISLDEMRDYYILNALQYHKWNVLKTARALKITAKTIYNFLYNKNIDVKQLRLDLEIKRIQEIRNHYFKPDGCS